MAENKTKANDLSVTDFLNTVDDEKKRIDSYEILEIMKEVTGLDAQMWGSSIVGFGSYHYKYDSGREGDSPLTGFSPRKQNLTLYIMGGGFEAYEDLLKKLGKHTTGKGCLYIKRLSDVDVPTLKTLIEKTFKQAKEVHGT